MHSKIEAGFLNNHTFGCENEYFYINKTTDQQQKKKMQPLGCEITPELNK